VVIYTEDIPNIDVLYTEDILNAIIQSNYPEQLLVLKVGMPVILIRNLNQEMGLCNGTGLLITRLADCLLNFTNMTSSSSGLNKYTGRKNTERGDCK
jgi:ATP-dependent DNA helicase PIF1